MAPAWKKSSKSWKSSSRGSTRAEKASARGRRRRGGEDWIEGRHEDADCSTRGRPRTGEAALDMARVGGPPLLGTPDERHLPQDGVARELRSPHRRLDGAADERHRGDASLPRERARLHAGARRYGAGCRGG